MTEHRALPVDRIDVWTVCLSAGAREYKIARDSLSPDERSRADRFVFEEHHRRFVLGRGALRGILAEYRDCGPDEIRFAYGDHGKPVLADDPEGARLEFNASGSEWLSLFAVTADRPVGIDVEFIRAKERDALVELFFAPGEKKTYAALPPDRKLAAFYRAWTRKEAYLKAIGAGMSRPLSSFEVTFALDDAPRLVVDHLSPGGVAEWTLADLGPDPHYAAALAVAGDARPICCGRWSF